MAIATLSEKGLSPKLLTRALLSYLTATGAFSGKALYCVFRLVSVLPKLYKPYAWSVEVERICVLTMRGVNLCVCAVNVIHTKEKVGNKISTDK